MNTILETALQLKEGDCFRGLYRVQNDKDLPRHKLSIREGRIEKLRYLQQEPLDPISYELRPHTDRGLVLASIFLFATGETKNFYLDKFLTLEVIPAPTYAGKPEPEQLFSVVNATGDCIVERHLNAAQANGYMQVAMEFGVQEQLVLEPLNRVSDDQVLARCG